MKYRERFPNKPVVRNINPVFNVDYVLNRGQIMVQVVTEPFEFEELSEEEIDICCIYIDEIEEE